MVKFRDTKHLKLYFKSEPEAGTEADIADELMDTAIQGYAAFAEHLHPKDRKNFWNDVREAIVMRLLDFI